MSRRVRTTRQLGMLLLIALVPTLFAAWLHPHRPRWHRPDDIPAISVAMIHRWSGVLWVDARSAEAFAQSRVFGAVSLPPDQWNAGVEGVISAWQPGRPVVVYCEVGTCSAGQSVARRLRDELGFENVHVLTGDWREVAR